MLTIGKSHIVRVDGASRLCAEIMIDGRGTTLWFAVDSAQQDSLCVGRADAFVMALLPAAMRGRHNIRCADPLSERLRYQLLHYLMPTLTAAGALYHPVEIEALLTAERYPNAGAVGTGFSGGVDSLYTVMRHGADCEYPLTHLAVFNSGVFEGAQYRSSFQKSCARARRFAEERGLETVFLDSNIYEALPERFLDVYSFRNLAFALALQGLFSVYLLSSGHDAASFQIDLRNSATYDLLTVNCAATESLAFYLSGMEVKRIEKLDALCAWEPSYRWLHPCIYGIAGDRNCGHCKKCIHDLVALYALDRLDVYGQVFDLEVFHRRLPQHIGFLLAHRENHLYGEPLRLLQESGMPIPSAAYACEEKFRLALQNLSASEGGAP